MVHNKISIDRFFGVGRVCELVYETQAGYGVEVVYPQNRDEYLMNILACDPKYERFWWDGWYYKPIELDNIINRDHNNIGNFYLFKIEKKG